MKKIKDAIFMLLISIICFLSITHSFFCYTEFIIRGIILLSGIVFLLLFLSYFFDVFNKFPIKKFIVSIFNSGYKILLVNLITIYRILICPVIILTWETEWCKWLFLSAFITDALDGFLARRLKATTQIGAKLDSFSDDCLFIVALIVAWNMHVEFLLEHTMTILALLGLYVIKIIALWILHGKIINGLHTYLSKAAAFSQAVFFIDMIWYSPTNILFYITIFITAIAIIEEIIIIRSFRELKQNTKGILFGNNH